MQSQYLTLPSSVNLSQLCSFSETQFLYFQSGTNTIYLTEMLSDSDKADAQHTVCFLVFSKWSLNATSFYSLKISCLLIDSDK